jgi:hypothetical protein
MNISFISRFMVVVAAGPSRTSRAYESILLVDQESCASRDRKSTRVINLLRGRRLLHQSSRALVEVNRYE